MTALSADRNTPQRDGKDFSYPILTGVKIYAGSIVVLDSSGWAKPGVTATGLVCVGMALETKDNTSGASGDLSIKVRAGTFQFVNGDTITKAHIGDTVYITDDCTVAKLGTSKSPAGYIVDVDSLGVWVHVDPALALTTVGLLAANNLTDVGSVATARSSLALDTGDSPTFVGLTLSGNGAITGTLAVTSTSAFAGAMANRPRVATKTSTYTLDVPANDGNMTILEATDNAVITLPAVAAGNAGQIFRLVNTAANGGAKISISPNSVNAIFGGINGGSGGSLVSFSGTNDKDAILTKATALKGDYIELVSDGATGWFVIGGQGIWASEA